jgi:ferredoxin-type protein NapH
MQAPSRTGALRTRIRAIRWISQLVFLAVWVFLTTGTVCAVTVGRGFAIAEPLGILQLVLAQGAAFSRLGLSLLLGFAMFVGVTLLLGRAFCAWSCPLGTTIDLIDKALERLRFRPFFARRNPGKNVSYSAVRNGTNKYAVLASALMGAALLKSPVWCALCPIGTLCRGAIAGAELSVGAQLVTVPVVGAMSLGEKRFWCRHLCPVGGLLTIVSRLNPFLKPKIQHGAAHRNCGACATICPEGIDICNEKTFARCTKCFDCYSRCPFGVVHLGLL